MIISQETKVTQVFFSPTENTKKSINSMTADYFYTIKTLDLTPHTFENKPIDFTSDELVIIGAPVYSGRIPNIARERFLNLKGSNTNCIIVVTYGNRHYDDALLELANLMNKNGFRIIGAAALVGRHTYGNIQIGRPNTADFSKNKQFLADIISTYNKLDKNDSLVEYYNDFIKNMPGNRPYRDGGKGGRFFPETLDTRCTKCTLCSQLCPTGAINTVDFSVDTLKCISCFGCIRKCPVNAKQVITDEYLTFAKDFTEKLKIAQNNIYLF